jgi:hypothetical protein
MHHRFAVTAADVLIGAIIVLGVFGCGERSSDTSEDADLMAALRKIDPALIEYEQTGEFPVRMEEVRALATGPDDRIYVAGDQAIRVFDPAGEKRWEITLGGQPACLAVGGAEHAFPGRIYVAVGRRVEVFDAEGMPLLTWEDLGEKSLLTSLAVAEQDVFIADAGNKIVWHYDTSGKRKGRISARDDRRGIPGFVIPSPCFDLAVGPDELLRVVNPGALGIATFTFDGNLELFWAKRSSTLQGFFGCCNPAHVAVLSNGRLVTAEKGIPRVKIYTPDGEFVCVVAGPEQLDVVAADVAVDGRDRVLILDPDARSVRILEHQKTSSRAE